MNKRTKICPYCEREHTTSYRSCKRCYHRISKYGDPKAMSPRYGYGFTEEERFWSRIAVTANPNKCWLWLGSVAGEYGTVTYRGRSRGTHCVAWAITNGRLPAKGKQILHSCDVKLCCNPSHLREGTLQENLREAAERNLTFQGENHRCAKLTADQVAQIKGLLKRSMPQRVIASQFGVSKTAIGHIHRGRSWRPIEAQ